MPHAFGGKSRSAPRIVCSINWKSMNHIYEFARFSFRVFFKTFLDLKLVWARTNSEEKLTPIGKRNKRFERGKLCRWLVDVVVAQPPVNGLHLYLPRRSFEMSEEMEFLYCWSEYYTLKIACGKMRLLLSCVIKTRLMFSLWNWAELSWVQSSRIFSVKF